MSSAKREVFMLVYHGNGKVPAHWAMFVPDRNGTDEGKKIHIPGNPFIGYWVEIKPYDFSKTNTPNVEKILLGRVDETELAGLEERARTLQAPGVSKTPLDPFASEHCQHWLRKYVELLAHEGVMDDHAVEVLNQAPKV